MLVVGLLTRLELDRDLGDTMVFSFAQRQFGARERSCMLNTAEPAGWDRNKNGFSARLLCGASEHP